MKIVHQYIKMEFRVFYLYSTHAHMLNFTNIITETDLLLTVHESKPIEECLPKIITEKFDF